MSHDGIKGVMVGWMEGVVPGIEELAAELPEPAITCLECGGTGWRMLMLNTQCEIGTLVECECRRELGGEA